MKKFAGILILLCFILNPRGAYADLVISPTSFFGTITGVKFTSIAYSSQAWACFHTDGSWGNDNSGSSPETNRLLTDTCFVSGTFGTVHIVWMTIGDFGGPCWGNPPATYTACLADAKYLGTDYAITYTATAPSFFQLWANSLF